MEYKLLALIVVFAIVTVKVTNAFIHPASIIMPSALKKYQMKQQTLHKATENKHLKKRSIEDNMEEYLASGLADQPHSRQKRAVFSGNLIMVGIFSGLACLLCVMAFGWSVYMCAFRKDELGGAAST